MGPIWSLTNSHAKPPGKFTPEMEFNRECYAKNESEPKAK